MKMKKILYLLFVIPFLSVANQYAIEESVNHKDGIVSLSINVSQKIKYDGLNALLFTLQEDKNLDDATQKMQDKIKQAISKVEKYNGIEIEEKIQTNRVRYNGVGEQEGWIVEGKLLLKSKDAIQLSELVSKLDGILQAQEIRAFISDENLAGIEEKMLDNALSKMKKKISTIQKVLGVEKYKISSLNISPFENYRQIHHLYALDNANAPSSKFVQSNDSTALFSDTEATVEMKVDAKIQLIQK